MAGTKATGPGEPSPGIRSTRCRPTRSAGGRRSSAATGRGPAVALRLDRAARAAKQAVRDVRPRRADRARGRRRAAGAATTARPTRRASRSATTAWSSWEHRPGEQANFTWTSTRVQRGAQEGPPGDRGARAPRHPRHGPGAHRHLGLRRAARAREAPRPAGRLDRRLALRRSRAPTLTPTRSAGCTSWSTSTPSSCSRSRTPAQDRPRTMGEYVPRLVPGQRLRDDLKPLEIVAAAGRLVHARGQPAALAAMVDAPRLQPARGAGDPYGRLRGRRAPAAGRAPALVRRDGRPLPRPDETTTRPGRRSTSASGASAS